MEFRKATSDNFQPGRVEMKMNEGPMDRVLRIIVGIGILSLAFIGPKTLWAYLGIIPLATGIIGTEGSII